MVHVVVLANLFFPRMSQAVVSCQLVSLSLSVFGGMCMLGFNDKQFLSFQGKVNPTQCEALTMVCAQVGTV